MPTCKNVDDAKLGDGASASRIINVYIRL